MEYKLNNFLQLMYNFHMCDYAIVYILTKLQAF